MENKKVDYKIILVVLIILTIIILTSYKIIKNRENRLYDVLYSKIKYAAKKCYLNHDCTDSITLNDLYEKGYLDEQYDPITKEQLNKDLKIEYKEDKIIINK